MRSRHSLVLLMATIGLLGGCATTTPAVDSRFGEALTTLKARQTRDPAASVTNAGKSADGMPAPAATNGMERYYKSFSAPAAPMTIINVDTPAGSGRAQ